MSRRQVSLTLLYPSQFPDWQAFAQGRITRIYCLSYLRDERKSLRWLSPLSTKAGVYSIHLYSCAYLIFKLLLIKTLVTVTSFWQKQSRDLCPTFTRRCFFSGLSSIRLLFPHLCPPGAHFPLRLPSLYQLRLNIFWKCAHQVVADDLLHCLSVVFEGRRGLCQWLLLLALGALCVASINHIVRHFFYCCISFVFFQVALHPFHELRRLFSFLDAEEKVAGWKMTLVQWNKKCRWKTLWWLDVTWLTGV